MVDIFDEVDEELRADRARTFVVRYGFLVVAAALAIVVGVAGWKGWRWYQARETAKVAEIYLAAMPLAGSAGTAVDPAARADFDRVIRQGSAGYRSIARLYDAALAADAGDLGRARTLWAAVAADTGTDTLLRDLATLTAVSRELDQGDAAALAAQLKPLLAATNPWHALAAEADALLDLRRGATEDARTTLRRLAADTTAPQGVRQRAGGLLGQLGG